MLRIWLSLMICISKPTYEMQHAFFISDFCLRKWKLPIVLRCTHLVLSELYLNSFFPGYVNIIFFFIVRYVYLCVSLRVWMSNLFPIV